MHTSRHERHLVANIADSLLALEIDKTRTRLSNTSVWIPFTHSENLFEFTGMVELEPGEPATLTDPGVPTQAEVRSVFVDGNEDNYLDILDPAILQRIAAEVVATFEG